MKYATEAERAEARRQINLKSYYKKKLAQGKIPKPLLQKREDKLEQLCEEVAELRRVVMERVPTPQ